MSSTFIEDYRFGRIKIEGKVYSDDVIILGKKVKPGWWRNQGHRLSINDLDEIISYNPDLLIVGTGNSGNMRVSKDLQNKLKFKIISHPTKKAANIYNKEIEKGKKVAGAFHLTC